MAILVVIFFCYFLSFFWTLWLAIQTFGWLVVLCLVGVFYVIPFLWCLWIGIKEDWGLYKKSSIFVVGNMILVWMYYGMRHDLRYYVD